MKPSSANRASAREQWLGLVRQTVLGNAFSKLSLSDYRGADATLKKVLVRPIELRAGRHLSFVFRHARQDITKNFEPQEGLSKIETLLGHEFFSGHLAAADLTAEVSLDDADVGRVVVQPVRRGEAASTCHDRPKKRTIAAAGSKWLRGLGVTTADGRVAKGMEAKFRQIHRFVELIEPLVAALPEGAGRPLEVIDMGCGKGYLTFAVYDFLERSRRSGSSVRGIESRSELVERCNRVAAESGFERLRFQAGTIEDATVERGDVVIALHACDTATDDAIAKGIEAGASLILVAPCCHKELRPKLKSPPVLASTLRHGILLERQAEFATDALRAALLEWAGYQTRVFEFIAAEHTNKNLMIAAIRRNRFIGRDAAAREARVLADFYGVKSQRLAQLLEFDLSGAEGSEAEENE